MWRRICSSPSCRRTLTRPAHNPVVRAYATQPTPKADISPEKRFISIVVAFSVGCSIYFFLEDPSKLEQHTLSSSRFSPALLTSSEDSTLNTKLIELTIPPNLLPKGDHVFAPIWSVFIKDDDIQVERPYTPLYGMSEDGRMKFWIKKYPHGEVGRWIHSKKVGHKIELRGPLTTWGWRDDPWDEVVMISGGTGITPFVQLFNTKVIKSSNEPKTRFTLIHCSRTPGELPPPELLNPMITFARDHPEKFKFHIFVDGDDGSNASASIPKVAIGRLSENSLKKCIGDEKQASSWWPNLFRKSPPPKDEGNRKVMFLVCGPEGMVNAIAGPFGRNFSQGPIGGILGKLGYTPDQVYKL